MAEKGQGREKGTVGFAFAITTLPPWFLLFAEKNEPKHENHKGKKIDTEKKKKQIGEHIDSSQREFIFILSIEATIHNRFFKTYGN